MHGPISIKSPNNTSKWQMGFNSVFKGLTLYMMLAFCHHWTVCRRVDDITAAQ